MPTFKRQPLNEDEHAALDRLSEMLGAVVDKRALPEALIVPVKRVLEAFGEDWSSEDALALGDDTEILDKVAEHERWLGTEGADHLFHE